MSKKVKHQHFKSDGSKSNTKQVTSSNDTFFYVDNWLANNGTKILVVLVAITAIFSGLLLNYKLTDGADDAAYIERAWDFLKEGKYPYFQGPAYPLSLSVLLHFFGLHILALKSFSVFCQIVFVVLSYFTFKNRVPGLVLFALLSYIALNNFFLFYAAQTYTEAFFLMVQALSFLLFFKLFDLLISEQKLSVTNPKSLLMWLLFGAVFTLLSISKSIALVGVLAVFVFLAIEKRYKELLLALLFFSGIRLMYELLVTQLFGPNTSNQLDMMMRVDMYDPSKGHEDIGGMFQRFFKNCNIYFSIHFLRMINLRKFDYVSTETIPFFAVLIPLILLEITRRMYAINKYIFFSAIYVILLCAGIFFGVQVANKQDRLLLIAMPLLFLVFFYGAYMLAKKFPSTQKAFLFFAAVMLCISFVKSSMFVQNNFAVIRANLSGDYYYGFTPDWQNYLKLSKFCADSLAPNSKVLCRKPANSFLYANGKKFIGEYSSPSTKPSADSILKVWKDKGVQYIIMASIRSNPKINNGYIINNIQRIAYPVYEKYPDKLRLVKTFGTDEAASLFELK
ncbi:MAG: hypothetical protein IPO70_02705 [Bacteroidetes bacterium]|nr:hypothetical protein [Bacteroidota bacterium]